MSSLGNTGVSLSIDEVEEVPFLPFLSLGFLLLPSDSCGTIANSTRDPDVSLSAVESEVRAPLFPFLSLVFLLTPLVFPLLPCGLCSSIAISPGGDTELCVSADALEVTVSFPGVELADILANFFAWHGS